MHLVGFIIRNLCYMFRCVTRNILRENFEELFKTISFLQDCYILCNLHYVYFLGILKKLKYDNSRYGKLHSYSYYVPVAVPYCGEFSLELAETVMPSTCIHYSEVVPDFRPSLFVDVGLRHQMRQRQTVSTFVPFTIRHPDHVNLSGLG